MNGFPLAFFQLIKQTSQSQDLNFLLMHNLQPPWSFCPITNHSIPLARFSPCFQYLKKLSKEQLFDDFGISIGWRAKLPIVRGNVQKSMS